MGALISAAAGALAAVFNQKVLVDPSSKAKAEFRAANPGATTEQIDAAPAIPKMIREGVGRPLTNIAIGVLTGLAMETWAKRGGAVQKAALPFGAGWIAYGAAVAVHDILRKQNESEAWYKADVALYAQHLATAQPTKGLYNVAQMQQLAQADLASGLRSTAGLYQRA